MKALLVLHGDAPPRRVLRELPALVVAVDGAAHHLDAWGVRPDVLVGDMDSIHEDLLDELTRRDVRVVRHPVAKDHTDGELALDLLLDEGATDVVVTGALGGRLDHTLANLQLFVRALGRGARVRAVEHTADLWAVGPDASLEVDLPEGAKVSVLPLSGDVAGVTIEGAAWTTKAAPMVVGDPFGMSNIAAGGPFGVHVTKGVALVVLPR